MRNTSAFVPSLASRSSARLKGLRGITTKDLTPSHGPGLLHS